MCHICYHRFVLPPNKIRQESSSFEGRSRHLLFLYPLEHLGWSFKHKEPVSIYFCLSLLLYPEKTKTLSPNLELRMKYRPHGIHKICIGEHREPLHSDKQLPAKHRRNCPHKGHELQTKETNSSSVREIPNQSHQAQVSNDLQLSCHSQRQVPTEFSKVGVVGGLFIFIRQMISLNPPRSTN